MSAAEQREEKRRLWEERVSSYRASGQSVLAWCKEQDIPEHQLRYWQRKLLGNGSRTTGKSKTRWVPLDTGSSLTGSGVSLRIGSVSLEVQPGFDARVLADVVRSLINVC